MRFHFAKDGTMRRCKADKGRCPYGSTDHVNMDAQSAMQYRDLGGSMTDPDDFYGHLSSHYRAQIIKRGRMSDARFWSVQESIAEDSHDLYSEDGRVYRTGGSAAGQNFVNAALKNGDAYSIIMASTNDDGSNAFEAVPIFTLKDAYARVVDDAITDPASRSGANSDALRDIHDMALMNATSPSLDGFMSPKERQYWHDLTAKMESAPELAGCLQGAPRMKATG